MNPRKKPNFRRHLAESLRKLAGSWRRPRGSQSKVRKCKKGKPKMPTVGYGAPTNLRYLHPSGFKEVLVHNLEELERVNEKREVARIAHGVGKRKKESMVKRAKELKIRILNP